MIKNKGNQNILQITYVTKCLLLQKKRAHKSVCFVCPFLHIYLAKYAISSFNPTNTPSSTQKTAVVGK